VSTQLLDGLTPLTKISGGLGRLVHRSSSIKASNCIYKHKLHTIFNREITKDTKKDIFVRSSSLASARCLFSSFREVSEDRSGDLSYRSKRDDVATHGPVVKAPWQPVCLHKLTTCKCQNDFASCSPVAKTTANFSVCNRRLDGLAPQTASSR
jgi:hypothetical protein